jgi:divalent metal cation (Fe/Co/Zn/Cd) transporter
VTARWVLGGAVAVGGSLAAFALLDPIIAAFVAIVLATVAVIAVLAGDWDRHSTFEERELERARRRKEKWERGAAARERDRARWEAHRARQQAKKTAPGQ